MNYSKRIAISSIGISLLLIKEISKKDTIFVSEFYKKL
jgi:hypothetical protein